MPRIAIVSVLTAVIGAVLACWFAATWGSENARVLPPLLDETGFTPWQRVVNLTDIILVVVAFVLLSARPRHKLLNLWLIVVMGYRFCDITLSLYLNGGRYDLGFYAGRIYGVLAASFVLAVPVLENSSLYRRLAIAASHLKERATEVCVRTRMAPWLARFGAETCELFGIASAARRDNGTCAVRSDGF